MDSNALSRVKKRVSEAIKNTDELAYYHDKRYKQIQSFVITLSAITTLLVALLQFVDWIGFKIGALVASTIASILVGFQSTFAHREKASSYDLENKRLSAELDLYETNSGDYINTLDKDKLFVQRANQLLSTWRTRRNL